MSANWVGAASLALAPAQSARCLGRREKGVPFLLGAALALRWTWVASGIFRAAWPLGQGEGFIGSILERDTLGRMASCHLALIQSWTTTRLVGGIERSSFL